MSEKVSKSQERLRQQMQGMMSRGVNAEDGVEERPPPPPVAESEERMVPTRWGLRPASDPSRLSVDISEGEHFDFRQLAKKDGVSLKDAVRSYVRACIDAGRVITEEDLEWLIGRKR